MTNIIVNLFSSVPPQAWTVIVAALAISGVQATVVAFIEARINDRLSDKTNQAINGALAAAAEGLNAVVSVGQTNPTAFGTYTLVIVGVSQFIYRYITLPISRLLADARAHRNAGNAAIAKPLAKIETPLDV